LIRSASCVCSTIQQVACVAPDDQSHTGHHHFTRPHCSMPCLQVRHLDACETMASATSICSDKTGESSHNVTTPLVAPEPSYLQAKDKVLLAADVVRCPALQELQQEHVWCMVAFVAAGTLTTNNMTVTHCWWPSSSGSGSGTGSRAGPESGVSAAAARPTIPQAAGRGGGSGGSAAKAAAAGAVPGAATAPSPAFREALLQSVLLNCTAAVQRDPATGGWVGRQLDWRASV
jgi:hypothetical protein